MSMKSELLAKKYQTQIRNLHLPHLTSSSSMAQLYGLVDKNNDKNKSAQNQFRQLSTTNNNINNSSMCNSDSNYSALELSTKTFEPIDDALVLSTESSLGVSEYESNDKLSPVESLPSLPLDSMLPLENAMVEFPHKSSHKSVVKSNKTTNFELSNRRLLRILHEGANGNLIDIRHFSKGPNGYNMYGDGIRLSLDEWNIIMCNRRHITQQLKAANSASKHAKK